jgi:hypothetical protein
VVTAAYWACLHPDCHETGTTTGTESGADRKHTTATGHATTTTVRAETAARWAGGK